MQIFQQHIDGVFQRVLLMLKGSKQCGYGTIEGKNSYSTVFYASHNGRVGNEGIIFGSDTSANNVLDDYEEGIWSPHLYVMVQVPVQSLDVSRYAYYVKVGRLVVYQHFIKLRMEVLVMVLHLKLHGLPFTVDGTNNLHSSISVHIIMV